MHKTVTLRLKNDVYKRFAETANKRIFDKLHKFVYSQLIAHPHYGPNIKKLKNDSPPPGNTG